jgi:predicted SAM-dependent methyltransferase
LLKITRTPDGFAYLHLWRDGEEYFRQKSDLFLGEWTNVRFVAVPKRSVENVFYVDLSREALDFPDQSFDAAYAYHVLEHLTPGEGARFVREVFRVLKPGGVFRTSVPDLESICRDYLHHLELVRQDPSVRHVLRYRWSVMEIFEQMVREKPGGRMMEALQTGEYDPEFIEERYSDIFRPILEAAASGNRGRAKDRAHANALSGGPRSLLRKLEKRFRNTDQPNRHDPGVSKERVRWMYDRLSLRMLMEAAGFTDAERMDFKNSNIPNWRRYDLDSSNLVDRPIDPSVYLESRRPAGEAS